MLKVVTLLALLVCTVVGARSCSSASPSSPFNPGDVARNGLSGLCANQQAVDAAGGVPPGGAITIPQSVQQELGGLAGSSGSAGSSLSCTTTSLGAAGDGG